MDTIPFQPSKPLTLGVELEFQLVDPDTMDLTPKAPEILALVPADVQANFKEEFIQSMLEIVTDPCDNLAEVDRSLSKLLNTLGELTAQSHCLFHASSLHPFAPLSQRKISNCLRYQQIMEELQLAGRRLITQGLHIHIGMPDKESVILVCDRIREYLPLFLALSCSSPYYQNEDTGFQSYRSKLFEALPRSGIPSPLLNWDTFHAQAAFFIESKMIQSIKEIWWDVRPHPDFGTIEIRICDMPSSYKDILALIAMAQCLADFLLQFPEKRLMPDEIIRMNKWNAARHGLNGIYLNDQQKTQHSMAETIEQLRDELSGTAEALGTLPFLEHLTLMCRRGNSAARQRHLFQQSADFTAMLKTINHHFWEA